MHKRIFTYLFVLGLFFCISTPPTNAFSLANQSVGASVSSFFSSFFNSLSDFFAPLFYTEPTSLPPKTEYSPQGENPEPATHTPPRTSDSSLSAQAGLEGGDRPRSVGVSSPTQTIQTIIQRITTPGITEEYLNLQLATLRRELSPQTTTYIQQGGFSGDGLAASVNQAITSITTGETTGDYSGSFTGTTTSTVGLLLPSYTPNTTTNTLYNTSGDLYWQGNLLAGATIGTWNTSGGNVYRSTGNVGIGTASPTRKLTIVDSNGAGTPLISIANTDATNYTMYSALGTSREWRFGVANGSEAGYNIPNNFFIFDATNFSMRMVIDTSGNMGVGVTSPNEKLQVAGNVNAAGALVGDWPAGGGDYSIFANRTASASNGYALMQNTNGKTYLNSLSGQSTSFRIGHSEIASLDSSGFYVTTGNVGIGTTTPSKLLSIQSSGNSNGIQITTNANPQLDFVETASGGGTWRLESGIVTRDDFGIRQLSGNVRQYFSANGNVGIGTTSPSAKLAITGSGTGTGRAFVIGDSAHTERFTVLDNGNIGIGTTSPMAKLAIDGTGLGKPTLVVKGTQASSDWQQWQNQNGTLGATIDSYGAASFNMYGGNTSYSAMLYGGKLLLNSNSGDQNYFIQYAGGGNYTQYQNYFGHQFTTNTGGGTVAMTIAQSGDVGIGTTTPASVNNVNLGGQRILNITSASTISRIAAQGIDAAALDLVDLGATSNNKWIALQSAAGVFSINSLNDNSSLKHTFFESNSTTGNITLAKYGGNVGIGTSTPRGTLHIAKDTGSLILDTEHAGNQVNLIFADGGANKWAFYRYDDNLRLYDYGASTDRVVFSTAMATFNSSATVSGDVTVSGNDLNFGTRDGQTYRPWISHDADNGNFDIEYNGQTTGSTNSVAGTLFRQSVNGFQFYGKSGDGSGLALEATIAPTGSGFHGILSSVAQAGNLAFQTFDSGQTFQMIRNQAYMTAFGKVPMSVTTALAHVAVYGDGSTDLFKGYAGDGTTVLTRMNATGQIGIGVDPSVALDVTGDIEYTGTITDVSDSRLKENITDFGSGLDILKNIDVKNYNMIASPGKAETGFIAQNVQQFFPSAVSIVDPTHGYMGVSYVSFIPVITKAIQELKHLFDSLKDLVTTKQVVTENLCVADASGSKTCITKSQLDSLLQGAGQPVTTYGGPTTPTPNEDDGEEENVEASSTDPVEESVPEETKPPTVENDTGADVADDVQ